MKWRRNRLSANRFIVPAKKTKLTFT